MPRSSKRVRNSSFRNSKVSLTEFVLSKRKVSLLIKTLLNTEKVTLREVCIMKRLCRLVMFLNIKSFVVSDGENGGD